MRKKKQQKNSGANPTLTTVLLSATVVSAIISAISSMLVSHFTNERLTKLETQKYVYEVQITRYGKLHEFLSFFSEFQVYPSEFIYNFSCDDVSAFSEASTMCDKALNQFNSQLLQLNPYLSDQSLEMLEAYLEANEVLAEAVAVKSDQLLEADDLNAAMKDHMLFVNDQFSDLALEIVKIIAADIYVDFVDLDINE